MIVSSVYQHALVARFGDNNLEMEKDWEMMTELNKDEFINKEMVREL